MIPDNLGYLFDAALDRDPSRPAVLDEDVVVTFGTLEERCNRVANALHRLGVSPGDRVALMFTNDWRFVECLLGPMRLGAVSVPLNTRMGDDALAYVVADARAPVLLANAPMADRARRIAARTSGVRYLVVDGAGGVGELAYDSLLETASISRPQGVTDPDDVCLQPYTSGSTGRPKGVLLTHRGQIWNANVMREALMVDETDRALIAVPLFHKNAMIGTVKPFLLTGGSFAILPGFDALAVIRAIERYNVTYMSGVPAMFKMLLAEREALQQHDVSSMRYAVCGSAEVPEDLTAQFQQVFGAPVAESYGLTEGGPVPIANTRTGRKKRGSCGVPVPGSEVRLVAADGATEVGPDEVGELVTRNPGVARGYWKLPDVTAQKFRDGWLYTGDLFRRDAEGYYYFVGRRDDMINVAGENVYPKEVEDILLRHPNVRDVYVVPAPHELKGEVPVAFVLERTPGATGEEELKRFFLAHGAPYAHPRRVFFLEAIPLSGTGKPDRAAMKQMVRDRVAGQVPS